MIDINKPTRWVNVYPNYVCGPYVSREIADERAKDDADIWHETQAGNTERIACVPFKDGDGI